MDAKNYRGWQSDVIVDLIKRYGFPYITLNPGASFRGLHDSLVNYGGNEPPMMLCQHEEIAVQIAHGYAKASGKPMAVILHNLVGLLHATMAIYYAYIDRVPIFIIGATGPMDEGKRRPHIDWTHSALVQGNAVRDYVKWDYQPTSIEGVPEILRARLFDHDHRAAGPGLHVLRRGAAGRAARRPRCRCRRRRRRRRRRAMMPDPQAIEAIADKLLAAEHPLLLPEYAGRRAGGFESIVELAETVGAAVWDVNNALNFPNKHPLCLSMDKETLKHTDLVVGLDVQGLGEAAQRSRQRQAHRHRASCPRRCDMVEIGFAEVGISKWSLDYCRMQPCSIRALGDTALGIPALTRICKARIASGREAQGAHQGAQRRDRQAARPGLGQMAGGREEGLGRVADHVLAARARSVGGDQGRGLGAHRQRAQAPGAQAVGLRQAATAIPASSSAPPRRSASRSGSRSRTRARAAWWSTSSPTAT